MFLSARNAALRPRPWRKVTPTWVASAAVALGATVASDCLLQPFFDESGLQRTIGAAMAALFGAVGTCWALSRAPTEWNALRGSATTGAVVLSWFMLCERLAVMHPPGTAGSLATLILPILLVVVAAVGAMVGTLFGLTAVAIVRPVERTRVHRSLDAPERVMLPASLWLCGWGLLFVVLRHPRALPPLGLVLLGLAGLAVVVARDSVRLGWLSDLHAGAVPGFRVVRSPSPLTTSVVPLPSYGPYAEAALDGRIALVSPQGGPYRTPAAEGAVARLPADPRLAKAPIVRRIACSAAVATAVVAAVAARLDPACLRW